MVVERRVMIRQVGSDKCVALVDYTSEGPRVILNGEAEYDQDVIDMANERLHYDDTKIEKKREARRSMQDQFRDFVEATVRMEQGKRTYGAETRGTMTPKL